MNNKILLKYVILKIQSNEWKEDYKLPSERAFMIKFNLSKNIVNSNLESLKKYNVIYSIPSVGNFVSKKYNSVFNSKTRMMNIYKVNKSQCDAKLSQRDIKNINFIFKNIKLKKSDFICFAKEYFEESGNVSTSLFFFNIKIFDFNFLFFKDNNFYNYLAQCGIIINEKITLNIKPVFDENNFNIKRTKKSIHSDSSIHILKDFNDEIPCIIKSFDFYDDKKEIYSIKIESIK